MPSRRPRSATRRRSHGHVRSIASRMAQPASTRSARSRPMQGSRHPLLVGRVEQAVPSRRAPRRCRASSRRRGCARSAAGRRCTPATVVTVPEVPSRCVLPRPRRWRSRCSASNGASRSPTWPTMASNSVAVDEPAAEALGQRDDADRQRGPGGDAALHLAAAPTASAATGACARDEVEPDQLGGAAADVEHQREIAGEVDQRGAARDRELGLRLAVDDLDVEAGLARARAPGTAARWRRAGRPRWRSGRTRTTRCRRILAAHTCSASMVRSMAASDRRPLAVTPSPRRMMRENASMTLKPRRDGRATSSRQLLVPRSSAA